MLVLDIETIPTPEALDSPYPEADRSPPSNYKADDAISRWREADKVAWEGERIKQYSKSPWTARIAAVGFREFTRNIGELPVSTLCGNDERGQVEFLWSNIAAHEGYVCTWNGGFDLRFLLIRSMILGVETPKQCRWAVPQWFNRYKVVPHYDVKQVLTEDKFSKESLQFVSEKMGLGGKVGGMTGADVFPAWQEGRYNDIANYCAGDVALTAAVGRRVADTYALNLEK